MDERTRDAIRRAWRTRAPDGNGFDDEEVATLGRILDRAGGRALSIDDPGYPPRLRSLSRPPEVIFLSGPWDRAGPAVAIVGSRDATPDGADVARAMASDLAAIGVDIVSGLAWGIDAAAHAGALAAGGRSGAVLGTGLGRVYPRGHEELQGALSDSLGLLSELLPGSKGRPASFASRNRLLAAIADAVVIVQGGASSGALLTVAAAESLGRPVGAVPWDPREALAEAPHALIRAGRATLVRNAGDVLALLEGGAPARAAAASSRAASVAPAAAAAAPTPAAEAALPAFSARVLAALRRRAESLDEVAARAGVPPGVAAAALASLELAGRARREPGGRFRIARRG